MTTKEGAGDAATKGRWGCRNKGALGNGNKREVLWNHNKGGSETLFFCVIVRIRTDSLPNS